MFISLALLFQAASAAPPQADAGAGTTTLPTTVITADAPKPKPKVVCKMEPVTGSRTEKIQVCKSTGIEREMDLQRDQYREFLMNNGNAQQPPKP